MSGRRAKALRRLAAIYRRWLLQERDLEVRELGAWSFCVGAQADSRAEGRLMRRYLRAALREAAT